jgi:hypothetical protein
VNYPFPLSAVHFHENIRGLFVDVLTLPLVNGDLISGPGDDRCVRSVYAAVDVDVVVVMVDVFVLHVARPDHGYEFGFRGSTSIRQGQGKAIGVKVLLPIRGLSKAFDQILPADSRSRISCLVSSAIFPVISCALSNPDSDSANSADKNSLRIAIPPPIRLGYGVRRFHAELRRASASLRHL